MLIKTLTVGYLETNCYVVTDEETLECAVIDPGAESNTILDYLEDNRLTCRALLITHTHFDHVTALPQMMAATGAPAYMTETDAHSAQSAHGDPYRPPEGTRFYKEGDTVQVGSLAFQVLETPGHTPGGVTLRCGTALFTGDTLFRGSCGRTDFPGGDLKQELASLAKLAALPGDYEVYPGHADSSTLSWERAHNPYMRRAVDDARG